jgi:hypothetical protein
MEMFHIEQEMVNLLHDLSDEELQSFVRLHDDFSTDIQIELFIYVCFLIFTRTGSVEYLQQAMECAEAWVKVTPKDNIDQARRLEIFRLMSVKIWQCLENLGHITLVTITLLFVSVSVQAT